MKNAGVLFLVIVFSLNSKKWDLIVPDNCTVNFSIAKTSESIHGFFMSTKNIVYLKDGPPEFSNEDLMSIANQLHSDDKDFAANIILYAYSKRDATGLYGLIMGDMSPEDGHYICNVESINTWKRTKKEQEIKYWNKWLKENVK